ncbi:NYN domain-containing protein [Kangiella shandongensis]|uniref:NYN domain-containing protein n=1 Tax=Kangiella shandongensis TaxID=2763258 RepID=UPI001CBAA18F|nr:NYN domain-containing protein [Kangiella shandongensis]
MEQEKHIALFIDTDNVSSKYIDLILSDLASHGRVVIRKAYGNWTKEGLKGWIDILPEHAIQPVQQFDLAKGKNATDMAMAIDVMDVLYTKEVDTFCLVTSDSDFTPLSMRLINEGKLVFGYGEEKTKDVFKNSCSRFLILDSKLSNEQIQKTTPSKLKQDTKLISLIRDAIDLNSDDKGWAPLGSIGSFITNKSSIDYRNYGYKKLSELIKVIDLFQTKKAGNQILVKDKKTNDD